MTKEQVQLLREDYSKPAMNPNGRKSTIGEYIRFCLDGNIDFVTSKDFVFYDDAHNMLHIICANSTGNQHVYPFQIMSCDYGVIQQIETVMSRENFEKFLDNSTVFSSIMSDNQKAFIKDWANKLRHFGQQEVRPSPYYTSTAEITAKSTVPYPRKDGIDHISYPAPSSEASVDHPIEDDSGNEGGDTPPEPPETTDAPDTSDDKNNKE